MSHDPFDFDAALAKKDAEVKAAAHAREVSEARRRRWDSETGAVSYLKLVRMGDEVSDAFDQFLSRDGKIPSDRTIWLPPDHPEHGKVGLDESCMKVPALESRASRDEPTPYSHESRRRAWEAECARVRAIAAAEWDAKFPRAGCLHFRVWEFEGSDEHGWVLFDERDDSALYLGDRYGSYHPSLEEIRGRLVDTLYQQLRHDGG